MRPDPRHVLVTVFGLGLLRPAPGTWGSLPPPLLVLVLVWSGAALWVINVSMILLGAAFAIACWRFGGLAEARYGAKDPRQVVADETAGQCVALLFLPWRAVGDAGAWTWNITLAATAFVAFRLFDIAKPPPINGLQRAPGGWGILADDLVAGLCALVVAQIVARFIL
ncbi:MAG: phosphatidylglycerophosphatase A family protein [Planctomycetota bacterium]|jgi:phosphatidylglycerophosphatase A